ncbi:f71897bd-8cf6-4b44-92cf-c9f489f30bc9 [Sclerotinia trifoliorum]|uniref:F71897bd-8cf6-4b44-92cf-c9f489f30bc9 n=1 Tax=Sclerotinia trifoliorum TaxID=28548 RepID=A0A8H2VU62_9HELO|nr:f71897bd-8cf6-4b44-92cf-c9f489f30bc9 [Sclerotinia trifoliorum]
MLSTTIRDYLSRPNPIFQLLPWYGRGTITSTPRKEAEIWDPIEGMEAWEDFNLDQVNLVFGSLLDKKFNLPEYPPVLPVHLTIRNERAFESVVVAYNCIIVNAALKVACEHLKLKQVAWLSGSYVSPSPEKIIPDWAGICNESYGRSVLPGDSKYAQQEFSWTPTEDHYEKTDDTSSEASSDANSSAIATERALTQVNHYAKIYKSRYCYLISPKQALLVRRRKDEQLPASESLAKNRPLRQKPVAMPSQSQRSESEPRSPSPARSDAYVEDTEPDTNMQYLQLCAVPWGIPEEEGISLNLALWAMHMISAVENDVRSSYPALSDDPALKIFSA